MAFSPKRWNTGEQRNGLVVDQTRREFALFDLDGDNRQAALSIETMHAILVSVGTDGDVFPYVGLGAALRARGHAATLVASEHYEPLARQHGLEFSAFVSTEENDALFSHPDFWSPLKTAPLMARWGMRFLGRQHELLSRIVTPDSVLVANPGVLAASLIHEKQRAPLANLVLQPWMIPSSIAPPIMPGFSYLAGAPRPVWRLYWRGLEVVVDMLIGRELNALRAQLGMKPQRRILQTLLSKQLVIGMFPEWFGRPQADWPAPLRLAGFPMFDGGGIGGLPVEVAEFCRKGSAPVAVTFGTGMAHSASLFQAALDASRILGARAIFLTKYRDQLPNELPSTMMHSSFAPFQKLFPLCAAVVHHGGIGTVAKSLAAGVPQLIQPLCFDQIDNGMRVKRLGAGDCLRTRKADGKKVAAALAALMTDEHRANCRTIMERFKEPNAIEAAATLVENLEMGSVRQ